MTTQEIYRKLDTPQNLVSHMVTVAGLVSLIKQNWTGPIVSWDDAITAALLHDVGNVVKFDLENFPALLGSELPRIDYWRKKQRELTATYGADDHIVTDGMLEDLGVSKRIRQIISTKSFGNAVQVSDSSDYEAKILLYCDLRVLPDHIGTIQERIEDIAMRLKKYSKRADFSQLADGVYQIESQIKAFCSARFDEVTQRTLLDKYQTTLLNRSNEA